MGQIPNFYRKFVLKASLNVKRRKRPVIRIFYYLEQRNRIDTDSKLRSWCC